MDVKTEGTKLPSYSEKCVDATTWQRLQHLVAPHVDSFDYFLECGLEDAVSEMTPVEFDLSPTLKIKMQYTSGKVNHPSKKDELLDGVFTPREARESGSSYCGAMSGQLEVFINDAEDPMV